MSYYPTSAVGLGYVNYPVGPSPSGVSLTASGSTNTKGSYAQIVASSPFASNFANAGWISINNAALSALTDYATGAAASEVVLLSNVLMDGCGTSLSMGAIEGFPCAIPSSTRISARCQASTASISVSVNLGLFAVGAVPGVTAFTTYGAATATSRGTQIDPGSSANTKGAFVQMSASTSAVTQTLLAMMGLGVNSVPSTFVWGTDLATGAAASEVVLIPDIIMRQPTTAVNALTPMSRFFLTYIAASTRLSARASCNGTDATDRLFDLVLLAGVSPGESSGAAGGAWAFA